jgi:uncharacterized protein DUF5906
MKWWAMGDPDPEPEIDHPRIALGADTPDAAYSELRELGDAIDDTPSEQRPALYGQILAVARERVRRHWADENETENWLIKTAERCGVAYEPPPRPNGPDRSETKARDANDVLREEGEATLRAMFDGATKSKPTARAAPDWTTAPDNSSTVVNFPAVGPERQQSQPTDVRDGKDKYNADPSADIGISVDDFYAFMPTHTYIFVPSRDLWPASSVNARLPAVPIVDGNGNSVLDNKGKPRLMKPTLWLDQNQPIEQISWAPGLPMIISGQLIAEGGWIERPGISCFNLYRPPTIRLGNASDAGPWLEHLRKIYGKDDADHITRWLAHRVQRPQEKINHALVLGGAQGIGKDTLLEPVKYAVGPWNFIEASPQQMLGRFNGFTKSVILRVSEARDLGDVDRFAFYDHLKVYTAAPPDVLRVDEKHLREHSVPNVCGVIITTNNKTDGLFLPADDRRHFVAWSQLTKEDFTAEYWNTIWGLYRNGLIEDVAAYLATLDISDFDPKAPPPTTSAFWEIVDANRAPEDAELADVLDLIGNPDVVTLARITAAAQGEILCWLQDRKHRRSIPHRLDKCGYVAVRNDAATDGLWVIHEKRQVIYAKKSLSTRNQIAAARTLIAATP